MGKKKKNKNKRKKYNKNQFIDIVCKQCGMCEEFNPHYCYNIAYLFDPETFMSEVYPCLLGHRTRVCLGGPLLMVHFREIFCYSGLCGCGHKMSCKDALTCYSSFTDQMKGISPKNSKAKSIKKQKKDPVIFEPYATFFISEDANFRKEIEGILSDGDRDIEQNSCERCAISAD